MNGTINAEALDGASIERLGKDPFMLHSGWELCCGETVVHATILDAIDWSESWNPQLFVDKVEAWLNEEKRIVERLSSNLLVRCFFVEVNAKGAVTKVLNSGVNTGSLHAHKE